ncbi:MAG: hypothetical protein GY873_29145 [Bosea sp.]|uniref:hypothetical protein n=1 Tax=Bosea sp. (in: a-proteobacteria) TaxID=1871050 RepID=UPI0023892052|nr:hypothetical protein [Bosea sp. (in: a-proteobacteria)]
MRRYYHDEDDYRDIHISFRRCPFFHRNRPHRRHTFSLSGLGMVFVGFGSMTKSTVKGGIAAAKFINEQKQKSEG